MQTKKQSLLEALSKLDPGADEHWTQDGLPRLDVVQTFTKVSFNREDLTDSCPTFCRTNTDIAELEPEEGAAPKFLILSTDEVDELTETQVELARMAVARGEFEREFDRLTRRADELIIRHEATATESTATSIRRYLDQQVANNAARAAALRKA